MKKYFFATLLGGGVMTAILSIGCNKDDNASSISSSDLSAASTQITSISSSMTDMDETISDPVAGVTDLESLGGIPTSSMALSYANPMLAPLFAKVQPIVGIDSSSGKYVVTITRANDTGRFGSVYSGVVIRTFNKKKKLMSLAINSADSQIVTTQYINLQIDNVVTNGNTKAVFKRTSAGFIISNDDSLIFRKAGSSDTTRFLQSKRVATQTAGTNTPRNLRDDKYSISISNYSEIRVNGSVASSWVAETSDTGKLIRTVACGNPIGGSLKIYKTSNSTTQAKDGDAALALDYTSNNLCERKCNIKQAGKTDVLVNISK